jgi:hypothetical protein
MTDPFACRLLEIRRMDVGGSIRDDHRFAVKDEIGGHFIVQRPPFQVVRLKPKAALSSSFSFVDSMSRMVHAFSFITSGSLETIKSRTLSN